MVPRQWKLVGLMIVLIACSKTPGYQGNPSSAGPQGINTSTDASEQERDSSNTKKPGSLPKDGSTPAPIDTSALDAYIQSQMDVAHLVGLEAIIVKRGKIVYEKGFGFADMTTSKPVTGDTIFRVASVSKTFTLTVLMKLFELGKFKLDDDINSVLPFSVRNPMFPNQPITYRMLLTHTSSIADNYAVIDPLWNMNGDATVPLATFSRDYFAPQGVNNRPQNFLTRAPGTVAQYSNMGISLAGYLVEILAAQPFADVTKAQIFQPLEIASASWSGQGITPASIYHWNDTTKAFEPLQQYGYPEVPAGMLRISGKDLARFLNMYLGGGAVGSTRLLKLETVTEIRRNQVPNISPGQGLVFYALDKGDVVRTRNSKFPVMGHSGADLGISSAIYWAEGDPDGLGIVLLANSDPYETQARTVPFLSIMTRLFDFGADL